MNNKVIELAKQAGLINGYGGRETASDELLQKFYTFARADYETKLSAVMPADFKDWHENNRSEWPDIAAWVITNLREQRADLEHQLEVQGIACMSMSKKMVAMEAENAKLNSALECIAGKRLCLDNLMGNVEIARAALGENK